MKFLLIAFHHYAHLSRTDSTQAFLFFFPKLVARCSQNPSMVHFWCFYCYLSTVAALLQLMLLTPVRTISSSARSIPDCARVEDLIAFGSQNGFEFAVLPSCKQLRLPSTFSFTAQF